MNFISSVMPEAVAVNATKCWFTCCQVTYWVFTILKSVRFHLFCLPRREISRKQRKRECCFVSKSRWGLREWNNTFHQLPRGKSAQTFLCRKKTSGKAWCRGKEQQPLGFLVVSTWGILETVQFGVHTVSRALGLLSHRAWMGRICRLVRDLCWTQCDRNGLRQP